jgi:iron-sulfur cluster assembly protein
MITLTAAAHTKVKEIMEKENKSDWSLRMGVRGGGCSGMNYVLGFDNNLAETDEVFEQDGVKLVCDMKSYLYLNGTEIDFTEGLSGTGFVFNNPNAQKSCGCGQSFSA